MTEYIQILLSELVEQLGEDKTKKILSEFSCELNPDVEYFLKNKAIEFSKQGLAKTHLVFKEYDNKPILLGYYSLAPKIMFVKKDSCSYKLRRRINRFATYEPDIKAFVLSAPLIAQLGKNFNCGYNTLMPGDTLLEMACQKIKKHQRELGGKITYLECEDNAKLIDFYKRNGFIVFGKRQLDKDEISKNGKYLIQLLQYFE